MYNPFSLANKTILVTGASSGIGQATAIECAKMGARVVLTARNEERLQATLRQLEGTGHQYILADLTSEDNINALVEQLPILDGVVFCAGNSQIKPIVTLKNEDILSVFNTNFVAPVLLTRMLVKHKTIQNEGSLVYIASISGNSNYATGLTSYGTSKSALTSFVKYAAIELAGRKIRSNAILPGRIETKMLQNQVMTQEDVQKDIDKYPLHRYGRPEEIAQAAIYYLSDSTKWVTGSVFTIDGGRSLI